MKGVTIKNLEALVKYLNQITDSPIESWTKQDGKNKANINNFHLDISNGGYRLDRMNNESGGIKVIIERSSKKELYQLINTYINGIELKSGERKE
jgi:hypothetical protein